MKTERFDKKLFKQEVLNNLKTQFRVELDNASQQQIYLAVAYALKEWIIEDWMDTQKTYEEKDPKILYYMSMEFLMGRALGNNLINMSMYGEVKEALEELASSIKEYGLIQPIVVTKKDGYYSIIAGERRWRAAKLAGLNEVPVMIRKYNENEVVEIALIENIQRDNLNPIEEAMAYKRLMEEFQLKQDEVAGKVSKSRAAITNSLRLLKLDPRVQKMLEEEMISTGHARALLAIDDEEQQFILANKIFDEKLSVRETEKLVKALKNPKKEVKKEKSEHTFIYENIEEQIKNIMGTKVSVNQKANGKGKIEIEYYSEEELERIYDLLMTIPRGE